MAIIDRWRALSERRSPLPDDGEGAVDWPGGDGGVAGAELLIGSVSWGLAAPNTQTRHQREACCPTDRVQAALPGTACL